MSETLTTVNNFMDRFIRNVPDTFRFQKTPSQIYPLSVITKYLTVPFPPIQSGHNTLIFIRSGSITQQIDTTIRTINTPCIVFISAGTIYSLQSVEKNLNGYLALIENKVFNAIFNAETILNLSLIQPVLQLKKDESLWIDDICKLLYEEVCRENPNRKIGQGLMQALLYKTLELSGSHKVLSRNEQIVIRFRELVNTHFKEEKTASFYAKELAISANYLNRCVQAVFHKSVKEIITEIAIFQSQILMLESSKDISEICFQVGFDDQSHFSRVFKKVTGQTPTAFKKHIMHGLS
jgi:AraC family transcriptional regulator, transcriptional activator of pobA